MTVVAAVGTAIQMASGMKWSSTLLGTVIGLGASEGAQLGANASKWINGTEASAGVQLLLASTTNVLGVMERVTAGVGTVLTDPTLFTLLVTVSGLMTVAWGTSEAHKGVEDTMKASITKLIESAEHPKELQDRDAIKLLQHLSATQNTLSKLL